MHENGAESEIIVSTERIEESIDLDDAYRTVTERYYTPFYKLDTDRAKKNDLCLLVHSNRIAVVTLAPSHPVVAGTGVRVKKVNCEISDKLDRSSNKAKGKSKKGGQNLVPSSILCYLETDEESYSISAISPGKLICMNKSVLDEPNLLSEKPNSDGHIAILLPNVRQIEACKDGLLSQEEYDLFTKKENSL